MTYSFKTCAYIRRSNFFIQEQIFEEIFLKYVLSTHLIEIIWNETNYALIYVGLFTNCVKIINFKNSYDEQLVFDLNYVLNFIF